MGNTRYIIGISLSAGASFLSACGLALQRRAHMNIEAAMWDDIDRGVKGIKKNYLKNWIWWAGIVMMFLSSMLSLAVLSLIDQSEAAPMASTTMVFNAILANRVLGERFGVIDGVSTVLMISGTIVAVVFRGSTSNEQLNERNSMHGLLALISREIVWIACICYGVVIIAMLAGLWRLRYAIRRALTGVHEAPSLSASMKLNLVCFIEACLAGIWSGFTGLATKFAMGVSINCVFTEDRVSECSLFEIYFAYIALPVFLFLQLRFLNSALQEFEAMQVVPIYQSFFILAGIASGLIFYNDFDNTSQSAKIAFCVGCAVTILGTVLQLLKKQPEREVTESGFTSPMHKETHHDLAHLSILDQPDFDPSATPGLPARAALLNPTDSATAHSPGFDASSSPAHALESPHTGSEVEPATATSASSHDLLSLIEESMPVAAVVGSANTPTINCGSTHQSRDSARSARQSRDGSTSARSHAGSPTLSDGVPSSVSAAQLPTPPTRAPRRARRKKQPGRHRVDELRKPLLPQHSPLD